MTLSPTNSRWSSLVFFSVLFHFSHAYLFPLSKKTSSRFIFCFILSCIPCIQFFANLSVNSLQILVRSYLSSELRWQVFSLWWTRSHRSFVSVQLNSFDATEAHNSVPPISLQERQLATCSCIPFDLAPLNDSCPILASHSACCFALWLKDQTHL